MLNSCGLYTVLTHPVKDETYKKQIIEAVDQIKELNSSCNVLIVEGY